MYNKFTFIADIELDMNTFQNNNISSSTLDKSSKDIKFGKNVQNKTSNQNVSVMS